MEAAYSSKTILKDLSMTIASYIESFIHPDLPQLDLIAEEERRRNDIQPEVGPQVGRLLALLVQLIQARRVLELGTCLGYSSLWLASALEKTGGSMVSIEYRQDLYEQTRANLLAAGLLDRVELIHGDAGAIVPTLEGPFDLILQDSDKDLYAPLLEDCIRLVRLNGLIVADDALFLPMGIPEKFSRPVHAYNQKVFTDPRLYSTMLPIGDGVTVSVKIALE